MRGWGFYTQNTCNSLVKNKFFLILPIGSILIMSENKSSSRHLTRKCKVLIQILADVFAFILSYAVSIVVSRFNAGDYAASSAAVCVVTLIVLYLLRYYSAKIELSSIELSQRCLKGVAAVYIASAVISLVARQNDFVVFSFLYLTYFFIFSLGARFIFKVMLQNRRVGKALKKGYPKAVVYGAGDIGTMLARQYFNGKHRLL